MSDTDWITDLARLAERATPGEWTTYAAYGSRGVEVVDTEDMLFIQDGGVTYAVNEADAEFIAAANPATILRLIEDNRYARDTALRAIEVIRRVEALVDALEQVVPPKSAAVMTTALRAALAAPTDTTKEN